MRHAGSLIEVNDGRLSVAAELALSSASGVAGLQRMSAPQKLAAFFALAAVDCEFADDRLARNLGLKLSIEMPFDDIATTTGTAIGQNRVELFINLVWGRRLAMGVFAVLFARLTARLSGLLFRLAFRERGRLSLGSAFEFFDAFLEFADDLLKPRILLAQLLILKEELLIRGRVHADLDSGQPCQLDVIVATFRILCKTALNKHVRSG
jgi:hypothetical protein